MVGVGGRGGGGFWVGQLKNSKPAPQILCTKSIPIPFLTITTNFLTRLGSIKRTCWFISWFYIENIFVYILLAFVKTFFLISAIVFEIFDGIILCQNSCYLRVCPKKNIYDFYPYKCTQMQNCKDIN